MRGARSEKTHARQREEARRYVSDRLARRDFDTLKEVLRDAEQLPGAPSRSTFYEWTNAWKRAREEDKKGGVWTLATPGIGRPDVVLKVLREVSKASGGRVVTLTTGEAIWVDRLAQALPVLPEALTWTSAYDATTRQRQDVDGRFAGELRLWQLAVECLDAENSGDNQRLANVTLDVALRYTTNKEA